VATYITASSRWVAAVRYTDPITGRDRRQSFYGKTDTEANEKAQKFRATPASARPSEDRPTTVQQLLGRWLSEKDPRLDRSVAAWTFTEAPVQWDQWKDYESTVRTKVLPALGHRRLDDVTQSHLRRFFTDLQHAPSQRGGVLSVSAQRKVHSRLTSAFRYAVIRGWLPADPMSSIPTPAELPGTVGRAADLTPVEKALSVPEMRRFQRWVDTRYADHLAYRVRWAVAFEVGLRQAETLGLTWECVDLASRTITVRQQLRIVEHRHGCDGAWPDPATSPCTVAARQTDPGRKPIRPYRCPARIDGQVNIVATTKSSKVRHVRVSQAVADDLATLYAEQHPVDAPEVPKRERQRVARARGMAVYPVADADLVIRHERGGHVTPTVDNTMWHTACDAASVSSIGRDVHAARHTAATHLVAAGVPLTTVQRMLGHSTIAVTQRYITTTGGSQDAALDALAAHLASIDG
jgi:integrase